MSTNFLYTFLLFFCFFSSYSQRSIKGRVLGEDLEILTGVKVFDRDTTVIGTSDWDGYFKIDLPKNSNELLLAGIGYEWTKITLPEDCKNIELVLLTAVIYDFMSSNKIDRLRKKRFEKLYELHSKAHQRGFFLTEESCVNREFEPAKPRLDRIGQEMALTKKRIKSTFKKLTIGDVVKIPSASWSAYTNETDFGCLLSATIVEKNKKRGGYNLVLEVMDNNCENEKATYNGITVNIGDHITHNMKYFKIIIE